MFKTVSAIAILFGGIPGTADRDFLRQVQRVSRQIFPRPTVKHAGERALFVFRYWKNLPYSGQWLDFLSQDAMAAIADAYPPLYKKIIRPYGTRSWTAAEKLAALMDNYRFWMTAVPPQIMRKICSRQGITLHQFATKNDLLSLQLLYDPKFNKEGETTLQLYSSKYQCRIAALTFHVNRNLHDEPALLIGCVQGLSAETHKDTIKAVAKEMHGLRPKALLVHVTQELTASLRIGAILGISNREHISRHFDYTLNRSRRPLLGYDEFWIEIGGRARPNGLFNLPLRFQPRNREEISSNKRAQYKQRYALLGAIQHAVWLRMSALMGMRLPMKTVA